MRKNIFRKIFFEKIKIVKKVIKNNISGPQNGQNDIYIYIYIYVYVFVDHFAKWPLFTLKYFLVFRTKSADPIHPSPQFTHLSTKLWYVDPVKNKT